MIPEFGNFALMLALCLACLQAVSPWLAKLTQNNTFNRLSISSAYGLLFFMLISFFTLVYAFYSNDFSVAYIAENSNTALPWFYRLTAVWGAHEGSMLLWMTILAVWSASVAFFSKDLPLADRSLVLGILGLISIGFLLFILTTSSPFLRLLDNIPTNGRDLNPLLQDLGFISHPPMLYMGYVGFSVAFAFAIAALISGRFDAAWIKWTRPWTQAAWCFLTLGITLGSWWSYRELGWGGWWAWDPVENASFLPWLAGTALIHCLAVAEKRHAFKGWTVFLAILAFSLSLLGTFLVRSGVLSSIHAFAIDPSRGLFMLGFLVVVIGCSLLLYSFRAHRLNSDSELQVISREGLLLANNVVLFIALLTVLLGTLYPLFIDALFHNKLSVGPPYFNLVFTPLALLLMLLMGIGPLCQWRSSDKIKLLKKLGFNFIIALSFTLLFILSLGLQKFHWLNSLGVALACWILASLILNWYGSYKRQTLTMRQSLLSGQLAMLIAHFGLAICVLGIVLSNTLSLQREVSLQMGDSVKLGHYQFALHGLGETPGPNYQAVNALIDIQNDEGEQFAPIIAQKRIYNVSHMVMSIAGIKAGLFYDLYVTLGTPSKDGHWTLQVYYKPFIRWIWFGGLLMVLGGLLALMAKRVRLPKVKQDVNYA